MARLESIAALAGALAACPGAGASLPYGMSPTKPTGSKQHRKDRKKKRKQARRDSRGN